MRLKILLVNGAGVLDSCEIETADDDSREVSSCIHDAIGEWILAEGDIIEIRREK